MNFVLEGGHRNVGDVQRLFGRYKDNASPEWRSLVGMLTISKKEIPGCQAADFLSYSVYRAEILEHGEQPSFIEQSSYVAGTSRIDNTYPCQSAQQTGPMLFRIPISRLDLQGFRNDLLARDAERRAGKIIKGTKANRA